MKKQLSVLLAILLVLPMLLNISSAEISRGDPFFNLSSSTYGPGQPIEGFVNFSLTNQNSEIKITANSNSSTKSIKLIDFLKKSNAVFTCTPSSCLPIYSTVAGTEEANKVFYLESSEKILGIKIQGLNNVEIKNISFIIRGSSTQEFTCSDSFVKLDILDDASTDYEYISSNEGNNCTDFTNSCFSLSNTVDFDLDSNPKCERIFIGKTGKVDIGAYITLSGDPSPIKMMLFDPKNKKSYNCTIDGAMTGFNFCSINADNNPNFFIDEARDVYVCISNPGRTGIYSIKGESDYPCGFLGSPEFFSGEFKFDYPLYIRYYGFSPIREGDEILFDTSKFLSSSGSNLISYLQDYISSRYSGNCLSGCIIPLEISANGKQSLVISDLELKFTGNPGGSATKRTFWDITKTPVQVTMPNTVLSFNAFNISAPSTTGTYKFILTLVNPASVQFKVSNVPTVQSVSPQSVAPQKQAIFYAAVQKFQNPIMNYTWDWGDGTQDITTIAQATHTYQEGSFYLTLRVTDSSGLSGVKSFLINATLSKESLNQLRLEKKQAYDSFSSSNYWYADLFMNKTIINSSLVEVQVLLKTSNDTSLIKSKLDSIKIPVSVNDTAVLPESDYYFDVDSVSFDKLSELGAGDYSSDYREGMLNELANWQDKINMKFSGRVKLVTFDDTSTQEITLISISLNPPASEEVYFIYDLPAGIQKNQIFIKKNIDFMDLGESIGTKVSENQVIDLAIPSKQPLAKQVFYASPSLSTLVKEEEPTIPTSNPSIVLPIVIAVIVFIVLVVLLVLIWKKKLFGGKNANSNSGELFSNPSDLMSLISYIQASQQEGKPKKIIDKELSDSGWSKAQIDYAYQNMGANSVESYDIELK